MPPNSAAALTNLQQTQAASQDPNTILSGQRQQLGVDQAQNTVTGLRGAINNTTQLLKQVAPSVMGRTANSLVTNAQATRQIGNEQAPLNQNLSEENTNLGSATQDLNTLNDKAQQAATGIYQGQQDKLSYAQNLYNTLYQKEKDAQATQQAEADRQEQIRQFNASLAASKAKNAGSGIDLSSLFGGAAASSVPNVQDQAYKSVQQFLGQGRTRAESDYLATLASANKGNAMDKLKVQLYNQNGIGVRQGNHAF